MLESKNAVVEVKNVFERLSVYQRNYQRIREIEER